MLALFGSGGLLLWAESQLAVLSALAALIVLLTIGDRTSVGREASLACRQHPGFANGCATIAVLLLLLYFREDHYTLLMIASVALYATACAGLNLQMAFGGVVNFAGAAFFSIGAYAAGLLSARAGVPDLVAILGGGLVSAVLGIVTLLPVLRTKGNYTALVTIAFGLMLRAFLEVNDAFGGPQGMKIGGFNLFGFAFNDVSTIGSWDVSFYLPYALLSLALFGFAFALVRRIEFSWIGIAIDAVRSDDIAAAVFGLSIARWKATAFIIGNLLIGMAGALFGMMNGFVTPNGAGLAESLVMLSIIVVGGLGNIWGGVAAAAIIVVTPQKLQAIQEYRLLIFAIVVVAILRFRPSGMMPRPLRNLLRLSSRAGSTS